MRYTSRESERDIDLERECVLDWPYRERRYHAHTRVRRWVWLEHRLTLPPHSLTHYPARQGSPAEGREGRDRLLKHQYQ